jgi:hypothetical protein
MPVRIERLTGSLAQLCKPLNFYGPGVNDFLTYDPWRQ